MSLADWVCLLPGFIPIVGWTRQKKARDGWAAGGEGRQERKWSGEGRRADKRQIRSVKPVRVHRRPKTRQTALQWPRCPRSDVTDGGCLKTRTHGGANLGSEMLRRSCRRRCADFRIREGR